MSAESLGAGPGLHTPFPSISLLTPLSLHRLAHPPSTGLLTSLLSPFPPAGLLSMVDLSAQAIIYEVATVTYMVSALRPINTPIALGHHRREQAVTLS